MTTRLPVCVPGHRPSSEGSLPACPCPLSGLADTIGANRSILSSLQAVAGRRHALTGGGWVTKQCAVLRLTF